MEHTRDRQCCSEGTDHRGARGQVKRERDCNPCGTGHRTCEPANRELPHERIGIENADRRRNDQEREHQQHARKRNRAGDHEAERRIEQEVPGHGRTMREPTAQDRVECSDGEIERRNEHKLIDARRHDVAGEDLLEMLSALWGALDQRIAAAAATT
jgi:hypothetical protein